MPVVDDVGHVELNAVEQALAGDIGGDIVKHQVAEHVGHEIDLGVARENRELRVAVGALFLQRRDVDYVGIKFVLVQQQRIVVGRAEITERSLIGIVRYLEVAMRGRRDQAEPFDSSSMVEE